MLTQPSFLDRNGTPKRDDGDSFQKRKAFLSLTLKTGAKRITSPRRWCGRRAWTVRPSPKSRRWTWTGPHWRHKLFPPASRWRTERRMGLLAQGLAGWPAHRKFILDKVTSTPKGAWKCNFPPFKEIMTERQTTQLTFNRRLSLCWPGSDREYPPKRYLTCPCTGVDLEVTGSCNPQELQLVIENKDDPENLPTSNRVIPYSSWIHLA